MTWYLESIGITTRKLKTLCSERSTEEQMIQVLCHAMDHNDMVIGGTMNYRSEAEAVVL